MVGATTEDASRQLVPIVRRHEGVRSANYAISSFNLRAAAIAFSFGLGVFKSASIKRRRASAVKVSVRSVPLLFPCLTRFATINFNSLSLRAERVCEWERTNTRSRETCFIADPSKQQVPRLRFLVRCASEQASLGMTVVTISFRERADSGPTFTFIARPSTCPNPSA